MLFVNLDKLKIVKEFNADEIEFSLPDVNGKSIKEIKELLEPALQQIRLSPSKAIAAMYHFNIAAPFEGLGDEDELQRYADYFLSIVNIITAEVLKALDMGHPREREKRLDVPKKLKEVKCSMGALKPLVNNETVRNIFNIEIKCGPFIYYLIDTKEIEDEEVTFVHDIDEAPELKVKEEVIDA